MDEVFRQAIIACQSGRFPEALDICNAILAQHPNHAPTLHLVAVSLMQMHRLPEASQYAKFAIDEQPAVAVYHNTAGVIAGKQGNVFVASNFFEQAIRLEPEYSEAYINLARMYLDSASPLEAERIMRRFVETNGESAAELAVLGEALHAQGRVDAAVNCLRQALDMDANHLQSLFLLGNILYGMGHVTGAESCFRRYVAVSPVSAGVWNNLGNVLRMQGRYMEAEEAYRKAVLARPDYADAQSNLLFTQHYHISDPEKIFNEHRAWGERVESRASVLPPSGENRVGKGRLKIAYLSPDLRKHSVAYFIAPLLAHHDRQNFEIGCYADVSRPDAVTERLRDMSDFWRDIAMMSDDEVCQLVREDGVDILIDLAGHTGHNRLTLFSRRPAPIQGTYLGYPGTTGLDAMDFRLTDHIADPAGMEFFYSEALLRLERCFLAYEPCADAPDVVALPALHNGYVTFGSFNHSSKLGSEAIDSWAEIMRRMPDARLLLKNFALSDPGMRCYYVEQFAERGVDGDRLELLEWCQGTEHHLSCYNEVDIALDTFPYNGTTTTCEALWMGVPVITLTGVTHAGRVGASLLSSLGLQSMIASDRSSYIELASQWGGNIEQLAQIRERLRFRMQSSALCDGAALARAVESVYRNV